MSIHNKCYLGRTFLSAACFSFSAYAVDFEVGDVYGKFDTTVSYGHSYRVSDPDRSIIGETGDFTGAGLTGTEASITGVAFSENSDDGNQNYDAGLISQTARFTSELDVSYKNVGMFMRFSGFRDFENADAGMRTALTKQADRLVTGNVILQDLYVWSHFDVGKMPASIRVGEQVLSWGESTFIQNGINVINPFNVSRLRTPGSEIRDALLPVGMVVASIAPTNNLSLEAYYQYDYERTLIEAPGSFFSTNDFVGEGANKVMLGFGAASDRGTPVAALVGGAAALAGLNGAILNPLGLNFDNFDEDFLGVARANDVRPGEGGEFGISLRYFAESLNDTEFGLYFINHHSRTPIISAITGSANGVAGAAGILGATASASLALAAYSQTANYFIEYPEDIQRLGLSFNTQFKGVAFQGEYTFIHDAPLQVDDVELLFAALCPLSNAALGSAALAGTLGAATSVNQIDSGCANTGVDQVIPGFIERNISQFQVTATKILGPVMKANQGVLVAEVGVTHVHGMPDKSDLRLNSAGTFTSGNAFHTGATGLHAGKAFEDDDNFADQTSWGYRIAGRLTYNNLFWGVNVSPRFAFSHDVSGNTPGPGGNFLEDRKAITLGLGFDYQNAWQADFGYTNFFGAGRHNLLNDRDFTALNLKYAF